MATTRLSDIIQVPVVESYSSVNIIENNDFIQSGIAVTNDVFAQRIGAGSAVVTMPYIGDLPRTEANYSNDDPDDHAVPEKIGTGEMMARMAFMNKGWAYMDLIKDLTGLDVNKRIAERIQAYWQNETFTQRVIRSAVGVFNDNVANDGGDMVNDVSGNTGAAASFSVDAFVDTAMTLGDQFSSLGAIAMHSLKYGELLKQQNIDFVRDADGRLLYKTYQGLRVVIDDKMPILGTDAASRRYLTILFGTGAFGYAQTLPSVPQEIVRDATSGHGGGGESLWTRRNMLIHPQGFSFTGNQLSSLSADQTGTQIPQATYADLAAATNWDRKMERKAVKMAFLVTK